MTGLSGLSPDYTVIPFIMGGSADDEFDTYVGLRGCDGRDGYQRHFCFYHLCDSSGFYRWLHLVRVVRIASTIGVIGDCRACRPRVRLFCLQREGLLMQIDWIKQLATIRAKILTLAIEIDDPITTALLNAMVEVVTTGALITTIDWVKSAMWDRADHVKDDGQSNCAWELHNTAALLSDFFDE